MVEKNFEFWCSRMKDLSYFSQKYFFVLGTWGPKILKHLGPLGTTLPHPRLLCHWPNDFCKGFDFDKINVGSYEYYWEGQEIIEILFYQKFSHDFGQNLFTTNMTRIMNRKTTRTSHFKYLVVNIGQNLQAHQHNRVTCWPIWKKISCVSKICSKKILLNIFHKISLFLEKYLCTP